MKIRYAHAALLIAILLLCLCAAEPPARADGSGIEVSEAVSANQSVGDQASISTDVYVFVNPGTASSVTFRVTDEDGAPIADARIYLSLGGYEELYGSTDKNGAFACYLLRGVSYGYQVVRYGYAIASGTFSAAAATRVVRVTVQKMRRVELTVVNGTNPVSGVRITAGGVRAVTSAEGLAVLSLPNGLYEAVLTLPEGTAVHARFRVQGDSQLVIDVGVPSSDEGEARLYDTYLGAGGGLSDMFIMFDKDYVPDNYIFQAETYTDDDFLAALPDDLPEETRARTLALLREALPNTVRVTAQPDMETLDDGGRRIVTDEHGNPVYSHRNLLMGMSQIALLQAQQIDKLALENDQIDISLSLDELCEDRIAKLLVLLYERGEALLVNPPDARTLDAMPAVTTWLSALAPGETPRLTYKMFANAMLEIRITPIRESETESVRSAAAADELLLTSDAVLGEITRGRMDQGFLTVTEQMELSVLKTLSPLYRVQVFITVNGVEFNTASLLKTLNVSLSAEALLSAERETLRGEGAPEEDIYALARERLMRRAALAAISSVDGIEADDYLPGDYTILLDTELKAEAALDDTLLNALTKTLQEQYNVEIVNGQVILASRTLTAHRTVVSYKKEPLRSEEPAYRLVAHAAADGLYLVVDRMQMD